MSGFQTDFVMFFLSDNCEKCDKQGVLAIYVPCATLATSAYSLIAFCLADHWSSWDSGCNWGRPTMGAHLKNHQLRFHNCSWLDPHVWFVNLHIPMIQSPVLRVVCWWKAYSCWLNPWFSWFNQFNPQKMWYVSSFNIFNLFCWWMSWVSLSVNPPKNGHPGHHSKPQKAVACWTFATFDLRGIGRSPDLSDVGGDHPRCDIPL